MRRKKPKSLTAQEALVTSFAKHSISRNGTFHPNLWSSGREPADMVISIGRSLLLFNMTDSGSYFPELVSHNLDQAVERIAEWSLGRQIRGKNDRRKFVIDWSEVDNIVVVCVVDGRHRACSMIDAPTGGPNDKIRCCMAVTSDLLQTLAILGGGARDLVHFARARLTKHPISSESAIEALKAYYEELRASSGNTGMPEPKLIGRAIFSGKPVSFFDEQCRMLTVPRRSTDLEILEVLTDFSWREVFAAVAFITNSVSEMEGSPEGQIRATKVGDLARLFVIVSSNMAGLAANGAALMDMAKQALCHITYTVGLTSFGLLPMFVVDPTPRTWAIDAELAT